MEIRCDGHKTRIGLALVEEMLPMVLECAEKGTTCLRMNKKESQPIDGISCLIVQKLHTSLSEGGGVKTTKWIAVC